MKHIPSLELKKKGIDNIGLRIRYKENVEEQHNFYGISLNPGDLKKVQLQKDVENYLFGL